LLHTSFHSLSPISLSFNLPSVLHFLPSSFLPLYARLSSASDFLSYPLLCRRFQVYFLCISWFLLFSSFSFFLLYSVIARFLYNFISRQRTDCVT
jgi:hypothetical protein